MKPERNPAGSGPAGRADGTPGRAELSRTEQFPESFPAPQQHHSEPIRTPHQ